MAGLETSICTMRTHLPPLSRLVSIPLAVIPGCLSSFLARRTASVVSMKGATIPLGHDAFTPRP